MSLFDDTQSTVSGASLLHFKLPRSLRYIMEESYTYEFQLRMTRGKWNYYHWGMPPDDGEVSGGSGIELWAYIEGDTMKEVEERWHVLTNALSGLFCASINLMDTTKTIIPILSFVKNKNYIKSNWPNTKGYFLYGSLPQETVCTENLTPFLKLLPCKGRSGISTLLDSYRLFDAQWYSMFLDVTHVCNKNNNKLSRLIQGVDLVLNIDRASRRDESPIPIPVSLDDLVCDNKRSYIKDNACFPLDDFSNMEWSLSKVFGRPISGSCYLDFLPVEAITVSHSDEKMIFPKPDVVLVEKNAILSKYVISSSDFDIKMKSYPSDTFIQVTDVPLFVERTATRKNQISVILSNPQSTDFYVVYLETLPWFMKPFIHTLTAHLLFSNTKHPLDFENIYFRPSIDRKRGSYFEVHIRIPKNSSVEIVWEFEKMLLRYAEYPPDPNRGFNIAPSIFTVFPTELVEHVEPIAVIRTTSLLLTFPTPDFSMPYNVIVLTSTVIAMLFGGIFNLLTRKFVSLEEAEKTGHKLLKLHSLLYNVVYENVFTGKT
ncbi:hypothetical protein PMAC_001934 [Pneumocystis sp. 'macacae']|nr:hypothetical protein PMAC_001934 [Pneumocystis sp. 'macacae']